MSLFETTTLGLVYHDDITRRDVINTRLAGHFRAADPGYYGLD